ncbi:MAG: HAD-IIIA family hydrolase [Candidatus Omnitrophica bacterium]|nr:HAD-IIIA family hydrolase [Candidatus Omnitrophota bacterium]
MNKTLKDKFNRVKLLVLDVDGILTDGRIIVNDQGRETKHFDVQDGFGIVLFQRAGFKVAIISARASDAVKARTTDLKISKVYLNARNKLKIYRQLAKSSGVNDQEVCFMGDDLPDLGVAQTVGTVCTVPSAREEIRKEADYITSCSAGRGAVREVIELILKSKGMWEDVVKEYASDQQVRNH